MSVSENLVYSPSCAVDKCESVTRSSLFNSSSPRFLYRVVSFYVLADQNVPLCHPSRVRAPISQSGMRLAIPPRPSWPYIWKQDNFSVVRVTMVVVLPSLTRMVSMVCNSSPVEELVVPAVVGVSFTLFEFAGWKVQACQSVTFDGPCRFFDLDRSNVNGIHAAAASGSLVGVRVRTVYLEKVVGRFEVPSVLKWEREFVKNEREAR